MDFQAKLLAKILLIPAILIAFTFRQYAQARVAVKLGDETPRIQGRLTLNPLNHIDPIGFIMILFVGFGWAKPIETDPRAFKNYYKDDLKVNLAGILASLFIGFIFTLLLMVIIKTFPGNNELSIIIASIVKNVAFLNCIWFFLWLLPIPGFDGFNIIRDLFPEKFYKHAEKLYQYQFIIFLVLILPIFGQSSIFDLIVGIPGSLLYNFFLTIANFII